MTDYINELATLSAKVEYRLSILANELYLQLEFDNASDYDLVKKINDISDALDIVLNTALPLEIRAEALEFLACWVLLDEIPVVLFYAVGGTGNDVTSGGNATGGLISWNQLINLPDFSTNHGHKAQFIFYESPAGDITVQEVLTSLDERVTALEEDTNAGDVDGGFPDSD